MAPMVWLKPAPQKLFQPTQLKDHFRFFEVPARKWWWALIALVVTGVLWFVVQLIASIAMIISDLETLETGEIATTPAVFLINNLSIVASIPLAVLVAWLFYKQGFGWLSSVVGRFRWKWFGLTLGVFTIGYLAMTGGDILIGGVENAGFDELAILPYTWFMIAAILLTTPLQAAAEEFFLRGLVPRLVCALIPVRGVGLILSALVTSGLFMWMHGSQDLWLNIYYFGVALVMWWLCYRTGGVEAAVASHIIWNLLALWTLPFSDFSNMFERGDGSGSPALMIYLAVEIAMALIIDWLARRRGLVRMAAPAASIPQVVRARTMILSLTAAEQATPADLPRFDSTVREAPMAEPWAVPVPYGAPVWAPPIPDPMVTPFVDEDSIPFRIVE
jgi:membrane protease YdiL (CAAX protease family)